MEIEEALGLVEEIKNCSLPWDDTHWEAFGIVINYVKNKLNEDFNNKWKPSGVQMNTLEQWLKDNRYNGDERYCYPIFDSLYQDLKKLIEK